MESVYILTTETQRLKITTLITFINGKRMLSETTIRQMRDKTIQISIAN